jgi:hypothetical protein
MRKGMLVLALLGLPTLAAANPSPGPELRLIPSASEYTIAVGAAGALLESDYFKAPTRQVSSGRACRMEFDLFDKGRLSSNCR